MSDRTRPTAPPGTLSIDDVARIWSEERRKRKPDAGDVARSTVLAYMKESRGGRYLDNPMPLPEKVGGYLGAARQAPWWPASQEQALRDWWTNRPGYGHGKGGRYAGRRPHVAEPAKRRPGTGTGRPAASS